MYLIFASNILEDIKEQISTYYDQIVVLIPKLGLAIIISLLLIWLLSTIRKKIVKYLTEHAQDKLLARFSNSMIRFISGGIVILTFLYIIGQGKIATSILGAAGISAFVIGFALKDIGENFLAGVIMAFDRPFRMGDIIKTSDIEGTITEMNLRYTHIKTFDGKDAYVPNGQIIKNPLYNYTADGYIRGNFIIGVDYNTDIEKARSIILEAVNKVPGVLNEDKTARTHVTKLDASSINIEVHYWIDTLNKDYSGFEIKSQAQTKAYNALSANNINVPFNIVQVINQKSSE